MKLEAVMEDGFTPWVKGTHCFIKLLTFLGHFIKILIGQGVQAQ